MKCACIISSTMTYPALLHFSTLFHERHDFRKEVIERRMFRFHLLLLSATLLILRRTQRDMVINVHWSSCKVPVILAKLAFYRQILEKYSNIKCYENPK